MRLACGDEMCGQEQEFHKWAPTIFKLACETFCLDVDDMSRESMNLKIETRNTIDTIRLSTASDDDKSETLDKLLSKYHNKKVKVCQVKRKPVCLHGNGNDSDRSTILLEIVAIGVVYEPGDHVGIFPKNREELVSGILARTTGTENPDEILQLQVLNEKHTPNGIYRSWENHEKMPPCSLRTLLTRFLDITTAPSRQLLTFLASSCEDEKEKEILNKLAKESSLYEDWKHSKLPHLLEVFEQFPSCKPPASLLISQLSPLQPRFYSISSSLKKHLNEIHLTVAVVNYKNEGNKDCPRKKWVDFNFLFLRR